MVCGLSRLGDAHGGREIAQNFGGLDLYVSVKTVLRSYQFWFDDLLCGVDLSDC